MSIGVMFRWLRPLVLSWFLFATASSQGEVPPCADLAEQAQHWSQLPSTEQHAFAERLFNSRWLKEANVVLDPPDVAATERYLSRVSAELAKGRRLSPKGAERLLTRLDALERRELGQLAEKWTQLVTQTWGADTEAARLREQAWLRVVSTWEQAGASFQTQPQLIEWLDAAIARVRQGNLAKLPPLPQFGQRTVPRVTARKPPLTAAPKSNVQINLKELEARIQGHNRQFATLLGKLVEDDAWTTEALQQATDQLVESAERSRGLKLYWDLLEPEDRVGLPAPTSPDTAIALLAGKVFATRQQLPTDEQGELTAESQTEWHALELLSHRLAELGTDSPAP